MKRVADTRGFQTPLIPVQTGIQGSSRRRLSSLWVPAFAGTSGGRVGRLALASVLASCALSGCGLRGDLVRPEPMWGNPPRVDADDPRTLRENEERARAERARLAAEREAARQAEIDALRRAAEGADAPPPSETPQ